jgi:DNA-binding XRE family transcriptional regulator
MTKQLTAEEIKAWRAETGLSQQAFAELLGISRPTVSRLEGSEISADPWLYYACVGWRAENGRGSIASQLEGIIRQIVREETNIPSPKRKRLFCQVQVSYTGDGPDDAINRATGAVQKYLDTLNPSAEKDYEAYLSAVANEHYDAEAAARWKRVCEYANIIAKEEIMRFGYNLHNLNIKVHILFEMVDG